MKSKKFEFQLKNYHILLISYPVCRANEAIAGQLVFNSLQLVTESTKGVNDETLDDGQQDQGDEQEEGEVKDDPDVLIVCTVRGFNHVSDTTTSPDTLVHVEDEAGEDVVAHLVGILALLTLGHVELTEEVESENGVDVTDDGEKANSQDQLLAVVGDGLQDDPESGNSNGNVDQMSSEEEVVVVPKDGEDKVEDEVKEGAVSDRDAHLPHLVPPVDSLDCSNQAAS